MYMQPRSYLCKYTGICAVLRHVCIRAAVDKHYTLPAEQYMKDSHMFASVCALYMGSLHPKDFSTSSIHCT